MKRGSVLEKRNSPVEQDGKLEVGGGRAALIGAQSAFAEERKIGTVE